MAITEDVSTPVPVTGTGAGNITTASFSPPVNSLLVALVGGGWSTATLGATITDSTGGTWTVGATAAGTNASDGGLAKIFYRYLSSAPGAMTVTAAYTNLNGGRLLAVRVVNGAASTQTGASGSAIHNPASTSATVSVTTTVSGSVVYGLTDNAASATACTFNAATTVLTSGDFNDTTDAVRLTAWKSTSATATPGATTFGGTYATATVNNEAAFEVVPLTSTTFAGAATLSSIATLTSGATVQGPPKVTMASVATLSVTPFISPPPAFPNIPRVITVELFVNGGWVDISSDVYVRNSIVIKRGRSDEQSRSAPSSCQLTIDNRSGNYSPRNPMGLYYGSLGRNTPIRVSIGQAKDTFSRLVSVGWGTSDTGHTYTPEGAGSSVNGSSGLLSISSGAGIISQVLNSLTIQDVDISAFATLPFSLPTGASVYPVLIKLRRYSSNNYVYAWARVETTGLITCGITHVTAGVIAAPFTTAITFAAAVGVRLRAQVEGQTYRVKVWNGSTPEPYGWTTVGTSTVSMTPGSVGFGAWATTGNTNGAITATIDNVVVRSSRFHGEVSSWPQRWDLSGNDVYVLIDGAGTMRRLVQHAPLQSPLRRFHDQLVLPPVDYWPCEDLKLSQSCASTVGDVSLAPVDADTGDLPVGFSTSNINDSWVSFSDYSAYPGSAPIVTLPQRGELVPPVGAPAGTPNTPLSLFLLVGAENTQRNILWTPAGQVMHRFLLTITKGSVEPQTAAVGSHPRGTPFFAVGLDTDTFYLTYWTGGFIAVETGISGFLSGPFSIAARDARDRDFLYSIQLTASGANTLYSVTFLEVGAAFATAISGTLTGVTMNSAADILFIGSPSLTDYHVGHVSTRLENVSTANEIFRPLNAWAGPYKETAGARFSRLCTEENVVWYYRGDLTQTTLIGPQGSGAITGGTSNSASLTQTGGNQTLLDLLYEVEDADLGMLYEPRGDSGLEYRTRRDLYSQSPTLTLDYSQGHVAPPLEPVDDDQRTRNNIIVSQPSGQSAEAELIAGRMSTLDPSLGGVGNYNAQYTINTTVDALADTATFLLSLGTVDEARYPSITVNLANPNTVAAALEPAVLAVNMGDLITVTNPKTGVTFDTIRQIVQGYTETLTVYQHTITFNTSPETPYRVAQVSGTPAYKIDSATSTLASGVTPTTVSLSVNNVNEPWTTDPAQMPIPIVIAGELMNVTAVSGTTSPQVFTVTRSVNGIVKTQLAGASVQIARLQRPFVAF